MLRPAASRRLNATLDRAAERMRHWLGGQALLMLILGGSATLTFGLMGLPYFYYYCVRNKQFSCRIVL
jgi:predicted PurR-regulated permease PerM